MSAHDVSMSGYGPSFLDEAFGGLARTKGNKAEEVDRTVLIISHDNPLYKDWAESRIEAEMNLEKR